MTAKYKLGFIGVGNLAQAIIKGLIENKILTPDHIYGTNRSPGKIHKAVEQFGIIAKDNNEELVEDSEIVVLAMKPQDMSSALDPIASVFREKQIVISLAAGVTLDSLS